MKYFKLFLLWLGFIAITSMFGEYIINREVNGFVQLLCFVVVVAIFIHVSGETIKNLTNNKQND